MDKLKMLTLTELMPLDY